MAHLRLKGIEGWLGKPSPTFLIEYLSYLFHHSVYLISLVIIIIIYGIFTLKKDSFSRQKFLLFFTLFFLPIFIGYLYSKLITSIIIGVLTLIAMFIFGLPNAPLISAIMTAFNMIPFFGPFLGAIPCVLLLLLDYPYYALLFIIITIVVQFADNQFLTPKIVGDRIGINPFWVLFSIILGGFFGGVTGMFFGVPIFAVGMAILKLFVNNRLRSKGLSTDTRDYHTQKVSK
jgi:predicted PurR-regulated permease PerM